MVTTSKSREIRRETQRLLNRKRVLGVVPLPHRGKIWPSEWKTRVIPGTRSIKITISVQNLVNLRRTASTEDGLTNADFQSKRGSLALIARPSQHALDGVKWMSWR